MKRLILLSILLSGCATIQEHPYATAFAVAFVAGSIAASTQHDYRQTPHAMATVQPVNCASGSCQ